jgi:UDP-glucuronate decarboxylase
VNTIGPRSCYDEGKRISETICYEFNKEFNIDVRVIRIFNTYGPFMDPNDGRVITNFINQALKNEDITIYGNGSQTRSFQYIDDLIKGIEKMMDLEQPTFGPINMGNPEEFTIKELAELILQLIQTKSKMVYKDLPKDDPMQRRPDITEARNILNWGPKINLQEGLAKTIEYYKSKIS